MSLYELIGHFVILAEHLPLEQGLRQIEQLPALKLVIARRASSIRTRIKTTTEEVFYEETYSRRASSIRTRIKTRPPPATL